MMVPPVSSSRGPFRGTLVCLGFAAMALACGSDSPVAPSPPPAPPPVVPPPPAAPPPMPEPEPEPEPECPDRARYDVTFEAVWNRSSHGSRPPFPSGAHFSRVVAAAHLPEVSFWSFGGIATSGIESMAETGSTSALCREIGAEAELGRSSTCMNGAEPSFRSPGSVSLQLKVTDALPRWTLVSMIAPSPDWFVGVSGMPLMEEGCWAERIEVDLIGYDSGTDSGTTFTAGNADVTPHEPSSLWTKSRGVRAAMHPA